MKNLFVIESKEDWFLNIEGVEVVLDKTYLTSDVYRDLRAARVFNLCRSYRYQTAGYYVSLLASARGHKPIPSVATIQDMKSQSLMRITSESLQDLIQRKLEDIKSDEFQLSIYFGQNMAKKYESLCKELSRFFHAPLMRADFVKREHRWVLKKVGPIPLKEVPYSHLPHVAKFAEEYFRKRKPIARPKAAKFSLAILVNNEEEFPPSNKRAIQKFVKAAEDLEMEVEEIDKDDLGRLAEFDGLFIRETTAVNHHTYRFAQKAKALGLVVIDDPESILKCTNKVYLSELLDRYNIPAPKTVVIHDKNMGKVLSELKLPCILKQPDSSFSQGVVKVETQREFFDQVIRMLESSDLIIGQEFIPTDFDWRIGIIDGKPLFVCKYFMAKSHWQIYNHSAHGKAIDGETASIHVARAPRNLMKMAKKAAASIGNGFYGIDVKQVKDKFYLIEVNDNPSIDAGVEDQIMKDHLYKDIMGVFLKRMIGKTKGRLDE